VRAVGPVQALRMAPVHASPDAPPPSGEQHELRCGDQRAVVVEVGGGLREYEAGGRPLLDGYGEREMCSVGRGQVLMPWPNRLRDGRYELDGEAHQVALSEPEKGNAIHGLVRWAGWSAARRTEASVLMAHVLHPQAGYPFRLSLEIEYALGENGLTVSTRARNISDRSCPFGAGAHPYLTASAGPVDPCTLHAPGGRLLETDDRAIPVGSTEVAGGKLDFRSGRPLGETRLDTCFGELERGPDGVARTTLSRPGGAGVELWQDEGYPYLMLFTGDSIPDPARRRRGLGVEPMTCAPNAFQSGEGLALLGPGETFTATWGIAPR
jgi:aldose 1-epimerase